MQVADWFSQLHVIFRASAVEKAQEEFMVNHEKNLPTKTDQGSVRRTSHNSLDRLIYQDAYWYNASEWMLCSRHI